MKELYSDFTKERVFEVHSAIMNYFSDEENEDKYWELHNLLDTSKIAIPLKTYLVLQAFLFQHLEKSLFGEVLSNHEEIEIECLNDFREADRPNLEGNDYLQHWFNLADMYEIVADKHIKPILIG